MFMYICEIFVYCILYCFYDISIGSFNKVFLEWNIYFLENWIKFFCKIYNYVYYMFFMVFVMLIGGKIGVYELEELLIVFREENV